MTSAAQQQSLAALARGNEIRMESAALRRRIRQMPRVEALRRVADLLEDPPLAIQRTRVDLLLRSIPLVGMSTVHVLVARAGCVAYRHVGPSINSQAGRRALTRDQRLRLAALLREQADRVEGVKA